MTDRTPVSLITGASGFSGRHLVARLRGSGTTVVATGRGALAPEGVDEYRRLDLTASGAVDALIRDVRPDRIYHLAGRARGTPAELRNDNSDAALRLLDATGRHAPDARLLMVGSAAEYGQVTTLPVAEDHPCRPKTDYGRTKHVATLAAIDRARTGGLRAVVARPFNIVGAGVPETMVVGALIGRIERAIANGEDKVVMGRVDTERDFVDVGDACEGYMALLNGEWWGEIFNIASGRPTPISCVVEHLLDFAGGRVRVEIDPALVRPDDVLCVYGSIEKAHRAFGYEPRVSLDQSLRAAWQERGSTG